MSGPKVAILAYHDIVEKSSRQYDVSREEFRAQLAWLKASGALCLGLKGLDRPLPVSADQTGSGYVLTFDDGNSAQYTCALPFLKEFNLTATFFVVTGWVGRAGYMDWAQLKDLLNEGMEIGSHSLTHNFLTSLEETELYHELEASRKILEDHLGVAVGAFSVPRGQYGAALVSLARKAGYRSVCTSHPGYALRGGGQFLLPRFALRRKDGIRELKKILAQEPWYLACLRLRYGVSRGIFCFLGKDVYEGLRSRVLRKDYQP